MLDSVRVSGPLCPFVGCPLTPSSSAAMLASDVVLLRLMPRCILLESDLGRADVRLEAGTETSSCWLEADEDGRGVAESGDLDVGPDA